MTVDEINFLLGELKTGFSSVVTSQQELKGSIENQFKQHQRTLEIHTLSDNTNFDVLSKNNLDIIKRLGVVETLADSVESQGSALLDLEKRVSLAEEKERLRIQLKDRDRKWIKLIVILVTLLVGDKFTGGRLSEWVALLFK